MAFRSTSKIDPLTGDAADAWSAALPLAFYTTYLCLECWDNALEVQLSYDGTTFQDAFEIDVDRPWIIPFQARAVKVKNKDAGSTSRYQIAGLD